MSNDVRDHGETTILGGFGDLIDIQHRGDQVCSVFFFFFLPSSNDRSYSPLCLLIIGHVLAIVFTACLQH